MDELLCVVPKPNSVQDQFEKIMLSIGWMVGALAISEDGAYYISQDVQNHYQAFIDNYYGQD